MKTIFVIVFLLVFFIISIPIFFVEYIIGKFNPRLKATSSQAIVAGAFRVILFFCGVKKTIIGQENIPKDQAVLYVTNHRSYFDILLGYTSITTPTGFVAKKEMAKIPFLRVWMRYLNCLFLDRENLKEGLKTILKGIEQVKSGYSVFIAPEGTRSKDDGMLPFKEGSLKIAEKSGCLIIPVAMNNTDSIFEKQFPWVKSAHVVIEFGQPINIKALDNDERKFLGVYVQNVIKDILEKNKSLVDYKV